jgi:hypothetical protein
MCTDDENPTPGATRFPESLMTIGDLEEILEEPPISMADIGASVGADPVVKCRFSFLCDRELRDLASAPGEVGGASTLHCDRCQRSASSAGLPGKQLRRSRRCIASC